MTVPSDLTLEGPHVRLEPLAAKHLASIVATCADPALWEYVWQPNPLVDEAAAEQWLATALAARDQHPFAIVDCATGAAIGSTRYLDISPENKRIEIGWTFMAQTYWRTGINRECKLLLLSWAFDAWSAVRVQLKADSANRRSRDAIARLGAVEEGTLRDFRLRYTGEPRGVTYFSILAEEWPAVHRGLKRTPTSV